MPDKHEVGGSSPLEPTKRAWRTAKFDLTVELNLTLRLSEISADADAKCRLTATRRNEPEK